jgi:hypothetical protein
MSDSKQWLIIFLVGLLCITAWFVYTNRPDRVLLAQVRDFNVMVQARLDSLSADNLKLSQNDSVLAVTVNQLHRRIRVLEADTVKGKKK